MVLALVEISSSSSGNENVMLVTIGFSLALTRLSPGRTIGGENNSVETTQLSRTETRHDCLAHGDLLRVSLYGRQG